MKKHTYLKTAIFTVFLTLAILVMIPVINKNGLSDKAFALNDAVTEADCRMCHCYNVPDTHHRLVTNGRYECLNCHQVKWNDASQASYTEIIRDCVACHGNVVGTTHHILANAGTYTCLDCHNMTLDTVTQQYVVDLNFTCITSSRSSNLPPIADAGPYQTISAGQSVSFSGAGSHDPDAAIVNYAWEFGDGSTGTGITTAHIYTTPGTYTVTLSLTDNQGAIGKGTTVVTVEAGKAALPGDEVQHLTITRTSKPALDAKMLSLSHALYPVTIENNGLDIVMVKVSKDGVRRKKVFSVRYFHFNRKKPQKVTFDLDVTSNFDVTFIPFGKKGASANITIEKN